MKVYWVTTHCSATPPSRKYTLDDLRYDHLKRGFSDVGYHYYITRDGVRHKGRNDTKQGAHVRGFNKNNLGVCLEGGVNESGKAEFNFTDAQMDEWLLIVKELQGKHKLALDKFKGHRDWSPDKNGDGKITIIDWLKECPCFDVQQKLKELLK